MSEHFLLAMPKNKYLNDYEKGQIMAYHESGRSNREISRLIHRSHDVVNKFVKNPETYGQNHKGGRKKVVNDREKRMFLRDLTNKTLSINQAKALNGINASYTTMWRLCNDSPTTKFGKMKQRPNLTPRHIETRLKWAQEHMSFGSKWQNVIFSDEKKFNLDGPDGYKFYWYDLRQEEKWFSKRVQGGGSLMVWAAIGFTGKTELVFLEQNLNGQYYTEVLQTYLLPFAPRISGSDWIYQHDNSSVHTSKRVSGWLNENSVKMLDWPSLSPDLNIIENLWGQLVRLVYANGRQYSTISELKMSLIENWENITVKYTQTLFNSMNNRIFQLILKQGNKIDY